MEWGLNRQSTREALVLPDLPGAVEAPPVNTRASKGRPGLFEALDLQGGPGDVEGDGVGQGETMSRFLRMSKGYVVTLATQPETVPQTKCRI